MKSILLCLLLGLGFSNNTFAMQADFQGQPDTLLPKVFQLGEFENQYEDALMSFQTSLLASCDNNMEIAFEKWVSMMKEMEAYSELMDFDLKGIKVWFNVFWEEDGSIKHIAFHLKPQSRNVDPLEFRAFLINFVKHYKFPLQSLTKYSHYGSAAFPTMPKRVNQENYQKQPIKNNKDTVRAGEKK